MSAICIFCRRSPDKFVPEHVFPSSIGGGFITTNVCGECNEKLGRGVDNDLANHRIVLLHRHNFNIKRDDRNIRNPLKGIRHKGEDGSEYYFPINENGQFESTIIPKYESLSQLEDGSWMGRAIMSTKHFKDIEETKKLYAKKVGAKPSDIERVEVEINPVGKIKLNISVPNKPLILGGLKIAYEFAVSFISEYLKDPHSNKIVEILLTNSVNEGHQFYLDVDSN